MRKWQDFVSQEQLEWVEEQLKGYDVVVSSLHGSMLYGLEREGSDVDIKAVYLPSFGDLLLGESIKTVNKKNKELDVEVEIKSLPSFLKSSKVCDTNCVDMLWTPDPMLLSKTDMWVDLQSQRKGLLSKSMKGLISYVKTHTHRYSNKIQRYQELTDLRHEISFIENNTKLTDSCLPEIIERSDFKYIKYVTQVSDHEQTYLEVCGKKYILSWECKLLKEALDVEIKRYGKRTKDGDAKGADLKSLSHALRLLVQLEELILTQNITFPLKDAAFVKDVKTGVISDENIIIEEIDARFEGVMKLLEECNLPKDNSIDGMLKTLTGYYKQ